MSRTKAAVITGVLCFIVGIPSALSTGGPLSGFTIAGKGVFDMIDFTASNILLPVGGLVITLFTGYAWKRAGEEAGLTGFWYKLWMLLLRYVVPVMMFLVFLYSIGILQLILKNLFGYTLK